MIETDIVTDLPSEPLVHVPKTSMISRETNQSRLRAAQYNNLSFICKLGLAKFPVYKVTCNSSNKTYAMKVFPLLEDEENQESHPFFQNEIRFAAFRHPNVIKTVHVQHKKWVDYKGRSKPIACILTEYASYGDFLKFVSTHKQRIDEKVARTYFRQLIEGLEYIHSKGAAHLDIKLENLLLDENLTLKIADFDLSAFVNDSSVLTKGTRCYRAPELIHSNYKACKTADIYSAGIVLFALKSSGILPHAEDNNNAALNLFSLLKNENAKFWQMHCTIQKQQPSFFNDEFKELFNSMVKINPEERATIQEIKMSKWYNGPIYTQEELNTHLTSKLLGSKLSR